MKYGVKSYFERELLDNALMAGMTPNEFWYGDPELYFNYIRVYEKKMKIEQQLVWSIGARFCQALQSVPIIPAGVVDKNVINSMPKYPECPYSDEEPEEMSAQEQELYRKKALIHFTNWVNSFKRGDNSGG